MTTLIVGDGGDFATIGAALEAAARGDVIQLLTGIYPGPVKLDKAVTLTAAPGTDAVIDGGWDGQSVTDTFGGTVGLDAEGAAAVALTIRNCPGRGIGIGASYTTVIGCTITDCYKGGLGANPPAGQTFTELFISHNTVMRVGLERLVTKQGNVNGSFLFTDVTDSEIINNTIANGLGEGLNVDRNSKRNLFEGNTIINCAHVGIYVNCAQDNVIRGNTVIYSGAAKPVGKTEDAPAGIIIGDERGASGAFSPSAGNVIVDNLIVGSGKLFQVRNNSGNYNTSLDAATLIMGNTFVAGPKTTRGIDIAENVQGRPHGAAAFCDNVIEFTHAAATGVIAARADARIDFHHNGWSANPTSDVQGAGDVIGDLMLTNPGAALHPEWDTLEVGFDADNYRPLPGSPLIGAASDGTTIGALEPIPPPPPDEPAGPTYAEIRAMVEAAQTELTRVYLALDAADSKLDELALLLIMQEGSETYAK